MHHLDNTSNRDVLFSSTLKDFLNRFITQYYPWLVISLCATFLFYKFVLQISPSVMTSDLMRVFKINGAGLGNLAATYFYAYLIAQLFAGILLDRYSPRYVTAIAIGFCALGAILFANAKTLLIAELSRALIGIGAAFATVSYMKMSSLWFNHHKMAFVDGLLATAAMTGALCGQIPLAYLVAKNGWQDSLVYCGISGIVLATLFLLLMRDKYPDSASDTKITQTFKLKNFTTLLRKPENCILSLYSGLVFTPVAILGGLWGNPFFIEAYHLGSTQAASYVSCIFVGLAIGGPIFGFLADRKGRIRIMQFGTTLALISLTTLIFIPDLPLKILAALLFIFGFGTGAFMSCFVLGKQFNDIKLTATIISLINTGDALFGSFTEPLVGKILDFTWKGEILNGVHHFTADNFKYAFSILPLYVLGALICLYYLKTKISE